ncbi:MAG: M1 family metallopeptidase [Bacteroidota bacterium]|nr:M1 family metallopeptidase [Bacteroidota bacterium]
MSKNRIFCIALFFIVKITNAQVQLPLATNMLKAYQGQSRTATGTPGKSYWQNKADYTIKVSFDPLTCELKGSVGIDYTNDSPDTLNYLLFKLYPNLYQKSSPRAISVASADLTDGVKIGSISIEHHLLDSSKHVIRGTNMFVRGTKVLPHQKVHVDVAYSYTLNKGSFIRTGQIDSGAFFIAYFFPRIAVYDDIDGWNMYPYTGQYEFYNDYGHFNTEITVPGTYQVWATGSLNNQGEVYQPKFAALIDKAAKSDTVVNIVTEADLKAGNIIQDKKTNTWKFEADNVTDFAFGISNHYVWKSTSLIVDSATKRRTRVDAVFNPEHLTYQPIINYARKTVQIMSFQFPKVPYPYSHETVFDGPDEMEFPMMVDNNPFKNAKDAIELTAHEIFHTLFPFYVGVNETKYSFMDEGWATMAEFYLHPMIDSSVPVNYDISDVNNSAGTEQDVPVMTLTPQLAGAARFADKDLKPALGYLYLKEMLGDKLFLKAMHFYISNWEGKHPTPYDFFNCINTASGMNLNWFWRNWFFEKGVPDLAISSIAHGQGGYKIVVANIGGEVVPVHLTVYYTDGSTKLLGSSVACWAGGNKTTSLIFKADKPVLKIVLGTAYDADVNPDNNIWKPNGH